MNDSRSPITSIPIIDRKQSLSQKSGIMKDRVQLKTNISKFYETRYENYDLTVMRNNIKKKAKWAGKNVFKTQYKRKKIGGDELFMTKSKGGFQKMI